MFDVTIDAGTVNTSNSLRDKHIKDESYFDVKNYPRIRFVSKKIGATNKNGIYNVTGQLTIKGKSIDISLPFLIIFVPSGFNLRSPGRPPRIAYSSRHKEDTYNITESAHKRKISPHCDTQYTIDPSGLWRELIATSEIWAT